jgi:hypothetical protein
MTICDHDNIEIDAHLFMQDRDALEHHLGWFWSALEEKLQRWPHAQVKVRQENGKIVDLIIDHARDPRPTRRRWWKLFGEA